MHLAEDAGGVGVVGQAEGPRGLAVVEVLGERIADLDRELLERRCST